jgi:hypothetical protein
VARILKLGEHEAVGDTSNPRPAPLPATFSVSAVVKVIANPYAANNNLSPILLERTFTPVTPESESNQIQLVTGFRYTNGESGIDQSSSSGAALIAWWTVWRRSKRDSAENSPAWRPKSATMPFRDCSTPDHQESLSALRNAFCEYCDLLSL